MPAVAVDTTAEKLHAALSIYGRKTVELYATSRRKTNITVQLVRIWTGTVGGRGLTETDLEGNWGRLFGDEPRRGPCCHYALSCVVTIGILHINEN
jgi:hypothetical protein